MRSSVIYELKARSDLWTGDCRGKPDRLVTTGLLGSIRWWFEVVVRGLGGMVCDPSGPGSCPDDSGRRCPTCEFFGCTGWARKFRFDVLDQHDMPQQIKKDNSFRFSFMPLRPIQPKEWALLDLTLRLIADYGAIGGKTVLKPSDEQNRQNEPHHKDYGLIQIERRPSDIQSFSVQMLEDYAARPCWRRVNQAGFAWASLANFWCVNGKYLARQNESFSSFNHLIGRPQPKRQSSGNDSWIAGRRPDRAHKVDAESKKVFSFKDPARTFGFVNGKDVTFDTMKTKLKCAWSDLADHEVKEGKAILKELLSGAAS
ncbi:CRISPR-associated RAMP protein, Cmr1 family (fragment) [Methylacidimicrobium sp. AP8]|uniref:type III-B CRISPR module RAMP protein Cmr1 n=1 Tax=Methylacidimicrobium sp. AP8 TaxID=2730359 RepID=UPI0018C1BD66